MGLQNSVPCWVVGRMTDKLPFDGEVMRLGDVCEIVLGQSPSSDSYNSEGNGLPFYQGNADFGKEHPTPKVWCDAPRKGSSAFLVGSR